MSIEDRYSWTKDRYLRLVPHLTWWKLVDWTFWATLPKFKL